MTQIDTALDFKLFEDANCCAKTGVWSTDMFTVADPGLPWMVCDQETSQRTYVWLSRMGSSSFQCMTNTIASKLPEME